MLPVATAHGLPIGDLGPACFAYDYGESAEIELTPYLGQVVLRQADTISPVQEEGMGDADVDGIPAGSPMELELPMVRSDWRQLAVVPGFDRLTVGGVAYLEISNKVGCSMYENSVEVMIKPICDNVCSVDPTEWVWLYRVTPYRAIEIPWDRATQRIFMIHFKVFVCMESGCLGKFGRMGYPYPESGTLESG